MNKYLRLFRLGNGLMGVLGILIGAFIATGFGITEHVPELVVTAVLVLVFIAGGNSLNDYVDRELDRTGHPERPLPMGEIPPRRALHLGVGGIAAACLLSLLIRDMTVTALVVAAAAMMIAYETGLKQRGAVGNLAISVLTGMLFLLGGAVVGNVEGVVIIGAMAMLVSIGREIAKDIEDMESDKGSRLTLPMSAGIRNSAVIGAAFFIAGPVLSVYPLIDCTFGPLYTIVLVADAMFIYCACLLFTDAHRSQRMAKQAMLIALAAFILGVVL